MALKYPLYLVRGAGVQTIKRVLLLYLVLALSLYIFNANIAFLCSSVSTTFIMYIFGIVILI